MPDRSGEPRPGRDEPTNLDEPQPTYGPTRTELRAIATRACNLCDNDGYRGTTVCDHQEHSTAETRNAARELIRQTLNKTSRDKTPKTSPTAPTTPDRP